MPIDHDLGEFYDDGAPFDVRPPADEFIETAEDRARWSSVGQAMQRSLALASIARGLTAKCESPIEIQLGAELLFQRPDNMRVVPQFCWYRFRMDFAILDAEGKIRVFIECDGAAFHCSPKQRRNDYLKDITAKHSGIRLFRFTGSEIFRHAQACAAVVWAEIGAAP